MFNVRRWLAGIGASRVPRLAVPLRSSRVRMRAWALALVTLVTMSVVAATPAAAESVGPEANVFCTTATASPPLGVAVDARCHVRGSTVTRTGPGAYVFSIPAVSGGGVVLVSALSPDVIDCQVADWVYNKWRLQIRVRCGWTPVAVAGYPAPSLIPADSRMSILWHRSDPSAPPKTGYYAYAQVPLVTASSSILAPVFTSNGGTLTIYRSSVGTYTVRLGGSPSAPDLHVQLSPYGPDWRRCSLFDVRVPGNDVKVRCYNSAGVPADSAFSFIATKDLSILGRTDNAEVISVYGGGFFSSGLIRLPDLGTRWWQVPYGPVMSPGFFDQVQLLGAIDVPAGKWNLRWFQPLGCGRTTDISFEVPWLDPFGRPNPCDTTPVHGIFVTTTSVNASYCRFGEGSNDLEVGGWCYDSYRRPTAGSLSSIRKDMRLGAEISMVAETTRRSP